MDQRRPSRRKASPHRILLVSTEDPRIAQRIARALMTICMEIEVSEMLLMGCPDGAGARFKVRGAFLLEGSYLANLPVGEL
jgi:hypothetical protein